MDKDLELAEMRETLIKASQTHALVMAQVRQCHSLLDMVGVEKRPPGAEFSLTWRVAQLVRLHSLYREAWETDQ